MYDNKAVESLIECIALDRCPHQCGLKEYKPCPHTIAIIKSECCKCWRYALQEAPF